MSDNLTPKYAMGTQIFFASTNSEQRAHDCPDCLNTHVWKVITPAGGEIETKCARCSPGYTNSRDLPSLRYSFHTPAVKADTITGICINEYNDGQVRYNGRHDGEFYLTMEDALAEATRRADAANANADAQPSAIEAKRISELTFNDARFDQMKNGLWSSWYAFNALREDFEEWVKNPPTKADQEYAIDGVRWSTNYRETQGGTLINFTHVAEQLAAKGELPAPLLEALEALPFRRALTVTSETEYDLT